MKRICLAALCLGAVLSKTALTARDEKRMDDNQLCQKLEDCYQDVKSVEKEKGKVFDIHVERLSWLVLVAGSQASGSKRLDAIFSKIQKESPTLVVPRFVMTPDELEKFIEALGTDDANDLAYSAYRRKVRTMSEWIADAKRRITQRSGFVFDPSVRVIHSQ